MILLRWFITTLAIFALPYFVAGIKVANVLTAVLVGACLVFLTMVVRPIIGVLTLPLNIMTLGLFSIVLNGVFFWFVTQVIKGFTVSNFQAAIVGALVISVINWVISHFID